MPRRPPPPPLSDDQIDAAAVAGVNDVWEIISWIGFASLDLIFVPFLLRFALILILIGIVIFLLTAILTIVAKLSTAKSKSCRTPGMKAASRHFRDVCHLSALWAERFTDSLATVIAPWRRVVANAAHFALDIVVQPVRQREPGADLNRLARCSWQAQLYAGSPSPLGAAAYPRRRGDRRRRRLFVVGDRSRSVGGSTSASALRE